MGIRSQNNPIAAYLDVFSRSGTDASTGASGAAGSGLTATGGVISDYTEPNNKVYRAHIFTSSDTFTVSDIPGDFGSNVEYLVVAGGGSGGGQGAGAGGGGAGGLRTNLPGVRDAGNNPLTGAAFPVSTTGGDGSGNYSVLIGGGAAAFPGSGYGYHGYKGAQSSFGPIVSEGGGAGGASNEGSVPAPHGAGTGGSGGGRGGRESGSAYAGNTPPTSPPQGNPGGTRSGSYYAGGGGGAGAAGSNGDNGTRGGAGGIGVQVAIAGPAADTTGVGAVNPGPGQGQWFAGGGGGTSGPNNGSRSPGGVGGGGAGGVSPPSPLGVGIDAIANTGGGGGGASGPNDASRYSGGGGSGVVIVRYKISDTSTARATGGAISFYGGKTIHTFTTSGTFATTSDWSPTNVEYVVVGGGGAGACADVGGAGGAGGYITNTNHPIGSHPVSVSVVVGGGGGGQRSTIPNTPGHDGSPSYFGTPLTAYGGGGGAHPSGPVRDGGSGGGGSYNDSAGGTGSRQTGAAPQSAAPITPQGNPGGHGPTNAPSYGSGGGGGAGGAGGDGSPGAGGNGGNGIRLPSTFHDPRAASPPSPWPGSGDQITGGLGTPGHAGAFYVGGGGGGSADTTGPGPGGTGGYGGGGRGRNGPQTVAAQSGVISTGGGGGAADVNESGRAGGGGSGIVLIAYPN
jgi:hypothetical protein